VIDLTSLSAIRGDTDESWTRGLSWLLRNRILGSDGGQ
jgi:hypothetical protein